MVSGDQFISDKAKKEWLAEHCSGYCTEMEGAAIAQAAYLNHIPYLVVRAISDKADDSANMDYETFEAKAIEHSIRLITESQSGVFLLTVSILRSNGTSGSAWINAGGQNTTQTCRTILPLLSFQIRTMSI